MTFKKYMSEEKILQARQMRLVPTHCEKEAWKLLRAGACGTSFRRQEPMLGFILDFYSPAAKLAVEIDGPTHSPSKDRLRDKVVLEKAGVLTLRFKNEDVLKRPQFLVSTVTRVAKERIKKLTVKSKK